MFTKKSFVLIALLIAASVVLVACGGAAAPADPGSAPSYEEDAPLCGYTQLLADDDEGSMSGHDLSDYEAVLFVLEGCGYENVICFGIDDVEGTAGMCIPANDLLPVQ